MKTQILRSEFSAAARGRPTLTQEWRNQMSTSKDVEAWNSGETWRTPVPGTPRMYSFVPNGA